jgi:hypothetical protein
MHAQPLWRTRASRLAAAVAALTLVLTTAVFLSANAAPPRVSAGTVSGTGTQTTTTTITATASATATATNTPPSGTPTPTPIFTCCEEKIRIRGDPQNVRITRQKNVLADDKITIQLDFELNLAWHCKKRQDQECRVYYEVTTNTTPWQERIKKEWVNIPWARVDETITTDPPIVKLCDGKDRQGTWKFTLKWVIESGKHVRHPNLAVRVLFPRGYRQKGTQYVFTFEVDGDRTKPRPELTLKQVKVIEPR